MKPTGLRPSALTVTTITIPMLALRTGITDQTTLSGACSLVRVPGMADITDADFMAVAIMAKATMIATTGGAMTAAPTMAVLAMDVDTIPARAMVTGRGMATAAVREDLREAAIEEATAAVDSTADMVGTAKAFPII